MTRVVAAFALALLLGGCASLDSIDPTESTFAARFENDLGYDAKIGMCSSYTCRGGLEYSDGIASGSSIEENISSDGVVQPFRIEKGDGQIVGCLQVYAKRYRKNLTIRLSRMTECPGKPRRVA